MIDLTTQKSNYFELKGEDFELVKSRHNRYLVYKEVDITDRDAVIHDFEADIFDTKKLLKDKTDSAAISKILFWNTLAGLICLVCFLLKRIGLGVILSVCFICALTLIPIYTEDVKDACRKEIKKTLPKDILNMLNKVIEYYDEDKDTKHIVINTYDVVNRYGDIIDIGPDKDIKILKSKLNGLDTFIFLDGYKVKIDEALLDKIIKILNTDKEEYNIEYVKEITVNYGDTHGDILLIVPSEYFKLVLDGAVSKNRMKHRDFI